MTVFRVSYNKNIINIQVIMWNRDGVVGIATRYRLEVPVIESRWGPDFPHLSRLAPRPTEPPVQWVPGFPRGKGGRGVHPHLVPRFRKECRVIPLFLLRGLHGL